MAATAAACLRTVMFAVLSIGLAPSVAWAQRDQFLDALLPFYRALAGTYGDEGAQLGAHVETMSRALAGWDRALDEAGEAARARLREGNAATALQVHVTMSSLYAERHRIADALREIDEAIRIDATRAPLHRFRGLLLQAEQRSAEAADAFRAAWLADSADPLSAYLLIVHPSPSRTREDRDRALATLSAFEQELAAGRRGAAPSPFLTLNSINDDAGEGLAFVPAAYAEAISMLLSGRFEPALGLLRSAVAADPLVADGGARSAPVADGISALRDGRVEAAIGQLEDAVVRAADSSERHRILATSYWVNGDLTAAGRHFRDAVRLNPRDERSWLALAQVLDTAGDLEAALTVLRSAVTELPASGALRWVLSLTAAKRQRAEDTDTELIAIVDRLVLLAGKADLYGRVARLAYGAFHDDRALDLLTRRVALTPNSADAHKALGRAYMDQGRDEPGYAELVIALLLEPADVETLTLIGRMHLTAERTAAAVAVLQKAVALDADSQQAVRALGDALARAGKDVEARQRLQESERLAAADMAQQRRQRTAGMLALQADVKMRERQFDAAADLWRQVVDLEAGRAANYVRLAEALAGAGRLEQAAAQLQMAISRDAGAEAHRRLAEVYAALGRAGDSVREQRVYVERRLLQLRGLAAEAAEPAR